jgi:tight adherence protein B
MTNLFPNLPPLPLLIPVLLFLTLAAIGWSFYLLVYGAQSRVKRRMAQFAAHKTTDQTPKRRALTTLIKPEHKDKDRGYRLRQQMLQAGLDIRIWHYLIFSGGLTLALLAAGLLITQKPLPTLLTAVILGIGAPKILLGILATRRVRLFSGQLADSIDIVVRGIRSGLPLGECINIIGREMPDPIGAEFRLMAEGQKLGLSLQEVLKRAVDRMPVPELSYFSIVIAIQQQTGGNLADTLAKLSEVLRARKRMREKVQAYASAAKASAMIIGSLPFVVMLLLALMSPKYLGVLFTTNQGNIILFVGAMTEIMGIFVMRNMINFEV